MKRGDYPHPPKMMVRWAGLAKRAGAYGNPKDVVGRRKKIADASSGCMQRVILKKRRDIMNKKENVWKQVDLKALVPGSILMIAVFAIGALFPKEFETYMLPRLNS